MTCVPKPARHARLFELIRQHNLAQAAVPALNQEAQGLNDVQGFIASAQQSLYTSR
jgi:hypothetical protein